MAQVDTGIYQNLLRPVKSVQEYDAEAQQAEGNKLSLLLQRGQYDAQQRGVAEDNAFRNALSSGADDRALMAASPTRALAFQEGRAKIAKEQALTTKAASEAKKTDWESAVAKQAHIAQLASSATDQASWTQARKIAEMLGADVSQVPEQFDPATAKQFGSMAMTQAQRLDQAHKEATLAETARDNKAKGVIAARNASTAEGQLGVSRQRLNLDQQAPKGHYDSERGTVTDLRTGEAKPVTMGGKPLGQKDKASTVTEGERNAGGYLLRMTEATKLLDKFEKTGTASYGSEFAGAVPFVGGMTRRAVMSDDQQQYRQAQEDWVRAKLRKESGASIPPDEMDREIEAYFPMPGEGEKVIAQKRQSRAVANTAMQQSAGRAAAQQNGGASGGWGDGWSIEEVK